MQIKPYAGKLEPPQSLCRPFSGINYDKKLESRLSPAVLKVWGLLTSESFTAVVFNHVEVFAGRATKEPPAGGFKLDSLRLIFLHLKAAWVGAGGISAETFARRQTGQAASCHLITGLLS